MKSTYFVLVVWLLTHVSALNAAEPALEKIDLFIAGEDGYKLYRIPGIVVTKSGTVLAYCEARKSDSGDWGPIDVLLRRSTDGGKTWLPRQQIVHLEGDLPINPVAAAQKLDQPGDNTVNNPVAIVDYETGAVHFLYCLEYMRCFYMRSDDDGVTWTEPVEITKTFEAFRREYDWKVLATGPGHGIQLTKGKQKGRLVVPVWLSLGTGGHAHRPSVTATIFSDDHGKTWQRGDVAVPDTAEFIYPNETVVVQLADGRVMLNSRSESKRHRRLVTISPDGATGWSKPQFDDALLEPICMAGIVRVHEPTDNQPGVIAFSNPHNLSRRDGNEVAGRPRDRVNVSIKLSYDEGKTWPLNRTLEEGFSGYSDLAALADGTILCFYERGSTDGLNIYRAGRLTVARFGEQWVRGSNKVGRIANPSGTQDAFGTESHSVLLSDDSPRYEADICVYGGTSGGIVAAVQAARMGKRVVLVEPGRHLGGMTSGGLSAVDIGDPRSVGGIAREYFTRLVAGYSKTLNWDQPFQGHGGPATGGAYSIEPHVAERLFDEMAAEAGVIVLREARLQSVKKDGARIVELITDDGRSVRAKMFIDATYEGDLMAAAGLTYTLMREGNAKYGETYNGIHYDEKYKPRTNHQQPGANGRVPGGQGVWDRDFPVDPYVIKGDPSSGLLPLLNPGEPGRSGEPAPGVQAYCFRLCLTTAKDRLPITPPPDYDPRRYELVARFIEACLANGDDMDLRWFSKHDPLPNDKWDFNTATFGGNLPGASWEWPAASYSRRAETAKEIENYHRALLHFLATDPRVPEKVRDDVQRFGLPRDEFTDNGGWPHQLYIREGRRMVSDLVMTEHHTFGRQIAPHSIGLGSYGTDTHEIRRIVKDGVVSREGKTATGRGGFGPYPIGYPAIVPNQKECENLFVTFALSASHTAFSSIRMEPVFMATSQSAATAASLAIDDNVAVQQVDYEKLKARLIADGQVLQWPPAVAQASSRSRETSDRTPQTSDRTLTSSATAVAVSPLAPKSVARLSESSGHDSESRATLRSNEPVLLAKSSSPAEIDGRSYDVVVVGGTASGVACAVRAAREGCSVLLVQHNGHIGGMMTNGLMQWDALYGGPRSPLFTELLGNIEKYYIATFGRDSPDHQTIRFTHEHYPIGWAEPHVAEREFNRLVAGEKNITLLLEHDPTAVERDGAVITSVTLRRRLTGETQGKASDSSSGLQENGRVDNPSYHEIVVHGATFVDATYEGDLFALAKVPYRVGREGREEYGEPHAGKVFTNIDHGPPQGVAREGLNIRPYSSRQGSVDPQSPFTADGAVQAYNYRFCVTSDPANRIPITKPAGYRREEYVGYERKYIASHNGPNRKSHVNSPILPGENHDYPEADWPTREKIIRRHLDFGLGLMWFLQNDDSIPPEQREKFRVWGLPKDEYADNRHVPYEMYVREARRIVGRHIFTEHDGMIAKGIGRTPVHPDSIAVTDWYMDSHSCTTDSRPGFKYDGKLILTEESRPSQIPYRAMLPQGVDNLLVPVCLSATHIAWGAIRLEPVFMQTGEAAGLAAALAKQQKTTPAALDADLLVRTLAQRRQLITFFNDVKADAPDDRIAAAQYFGTKGFFADYNARLNEPLRDATAKAWAEGLTQLNAGTLDANHLAARVHKCESSDSPLTAGTRGDVLPQMWIERNKP